MSIGSKVRCLLGFSVVFGWASASMAQGNKKLAWLDEEPVPQWVWDSKGSSDGQTIYLQKTFSLTAPIKSAKLYTTCDNKMTLWVNGKEIDSSPDWMYPIQNEITKQLVVGKNTVAVRAQNAGGTAAYVFKLSVEHDDGKKTTVISDPTWNVSREPPAKEWHAVDFDATAWSDKLKSVDRLGAAPWGIPGGARRPAKGSVSEPDEIDVPDGFVVDLLHKVDQEKHGSWVSLTTGPNGRLIACDQGNKGVCIIEITETSDGPQVKIEELDVAASGNSQRLSGAQGMLWAFDSLWFHRNGGNLYRITDSDGDGKLDSAEEIPSERGGGEHGNHAVILSEDGKGIYMDGGNHAPLAAVQSSHVSNWDEDLLLPRMWDANGHARGKLAPGGWVTRLDPETMQQELICIGFRNQYDIALNRYGDMFTFDADMEWDMGSPWYRPTRICHVVSGGDYGWRSGTGKWPTYYEDSLPPVVDIGPGSPTGVTAGIGAKFPAKYQDAIYTLDWTFGTIYAIHMQHDGAGYTGTSEPFVTGSPLPVTDAVVATDGWLYFTVGGRGAQSALYRVRYEGDESTRLVTTMPLPDDVRQARDTRKQLEQYHGKSLSGEAAEYAIEFAWPNLSSDDRFLRAAARVAIESQPIQLWGERAVLESSPQAKITGTIALARVGEKTHQAAMLAGLLGIDAKSRSDSQMLGLMRAYALTFIRQGKPTEIQREQILSQLDPLLPHSNDDVNTELIRVMTYLESPTVIEKAMALIKNRKPPEIPDWSELASRNAGYGGTVQGILDNHPPIREISYALMLRNLRKGWTLDQRRAYFEFLNEAAKGSGGASFPGFMRNIRDEALGNCSDAERVALQDITGEDYDPVPDFEIKPIAGPGQVWTTNDARSKSANRFKQADYENGRSLYFAANCGKCHRFAGLGGNVGPDLTTIPRKFDVNYVIEHVIEPSKVISDQYQSSVVLTDDGRTLTGLMSEADGKVVIYPADAKAEPITLSSDEVEQVRPSPVSQMPKGLIDGLNADELRDLLAYLMSGGDEKNEKVYGKR